MLNIPCSHAAVLFRFSLHLRPSNHVYLGFPHRARLATGGSSTVLHRPASHSRRVIFFLLQRRHNPRNPRTGFGARSLFDGMPQSKKASMACGADRISALPDALLQHVLSFLQAQEAVRSCVLARRWRHLWKSMPVLRLTGGRPVQESRKFVDHVIALRGHCPLHSCLFYFDRYSEGDVSYVNLWIQYALLCQVTVLNVAFRGHCHSFPLAQLPLVSQNLTELKLHYLHLNNKFLDFSSCPALEDLNMTDCDIPADKISSRSLKRLSIGKCNFIHGTRTRISLPCLTSLQLTAIMGRAPFLEDMPALVTATIVRATATFPFENGDYNVDYVSCGDTSCVCCYGYDNADPEFCRDAYCECCYGTDDSREGCVLLKGLSAATNLKLIAETDLIILKRDLRWCPTFSKLKTLLLSGCGVAGDHHALICILQHTPILENLTLQLYETREYMEPVKATYNLLEQSFASENLKIVEVACKEIDETIHNIMKSLSIYGIPLEKINIRQINKSSECFNFVCTGFSSKQG